MGHTEQSGAGWIWPWASLLTSDCFQNGPWEGSCVPAQLNSPQTVVIWDSQSEGWETKGGLQQVDSWQEQGCRERGSEWRFPKRPQEELLPLPTEVQLWNAEKSYREKDSNKVWACLSWAQPSFSPPGLKYKAPRPGYCRIRVTDGQQAVTRTPTSAFTDTALWLTGLPQRAQIKDCISRVQYSNWNSSPPDVLLWCPPPLNTPFPTCPPPPSAQFHSALTLSVEGGPCQITPVPARSWAGNGSEPQAEMVFILFCFSYLKRQALTTDSVLWDSATVTGARSRFVNYLCVWLPPRSSPIILYCWAQLHHCDDFQPTLWHI